MTSFGITTAKQFFSKLIEEQKDFRASHCLSEQHAINAIITAYHLCDWVQQEIDHDKQGWPSSEVERLDGG
jgi:hypothetical protein